MAKRITKVEGSVQKVRELVADPNKPDVTTVPAQVVAKTPGAVSFWQKVKGYYKGLIAAVGFLAAALASPQVGVLNQLLPAEYQKYLSIAIGVVTVVGVILKENEHWFEDSQVG